MHKKKSFYIKSKVVLVVIGFSLFLFGGLLFTFIKSSKMDIEHVEITEITEKVQIDVLLTTIAMDEFYLYGDTSFVGNISNSFKNAEDHLSSISAKIRSHNLSNINSNRNDFIRKLNEIRDQVIILESLTTKDKLMNSRVDNTAIKQAYLVFNKSLVV